uniref:Uncharacterized protein n=1 Tax=viral metagenome TaxID=1070528 RepID=A0A6M3J542_9ZZZZ
MSDLLFEQALAACNEEFRQAEEFGDDWYPDDGTYVTVVTDVKKGVKVSDATGSGEPTLWWRLKLRIDDTMNERVHGKEFPMPLSSRFWGKVKNISRALNRGQVAISAKEADAILEAARGKVLEVNVYTTTSDKNGRQYRNVSIKNILRVSKVEPMQEGNPAPEA